MKALIFFIPFMAFNALAADEISVTIDSHSNASNYLLETCGTAKHSAGLKPLLVTVTHDQSNYTTLTNKDGNWCVVIKRWTYNSEVSAEATVLGRDDIRPATLEKRF